MSPRSGTNGARSGSPWWLSRIETLGSTIVVLMVGGMVILAKAPARGPSMAMVIGSGAVVYVLVLLALGRRSPSPAVPWAPFAIAGAAAGAVAELINAEMLLTREFAAACVTGAVIGTAQWTALRTWLRVIRRGKG